MQQPKVLEEQVSEQLRNQSVLVGEVVNGQYWGIVRCTVKMSKTDPRAGFAVVAGRKCKVLQRFPGKTRSTFSWFFLSWEE